MWNGYAPNGVAIRTSLTQLEAALAGTGRKWRISRMLYWDTRREIVPDDTHHEPVLKEMLRHPHLLKAKEYEYEKEIRLCTVDASERAHLVVQGVPPESWIQEIRVSPKIWHQDAQVLVDQIANSCPQLKTSINISLLTSTPGIAENFEEQVNADVGQSEAKHWPGFLHSP